MLRACKTNIVCRCYVFHENFDLCFVGWRQGRKGLWKGKGEGDLPLSKGRTTGKNDPYINNNHLCTRFAKYLCSWRVKISMFGQCFEPALLPSPLPITVPGRPYPQASEEPYDQPWPCGRHSRRLQRSYPRISDRWGENFFKICSNRREIPICSRSKNIIRALVATPRDENKTSHLLLTLYSFPFLIKTQPSPKCTKNMRFYVLNSYS